MNDILKATLRRAAQRVVEELDEALKAADRAGVQLPELECARCDASMFLTRTLKGKPSRPKSVPLT